MLEILSFFKKQIAKVWYIFATDTKIKTYLIVLLVLFFISNKNYAQEDGELGFFAGVGYYNGEINKQKIFYKPKPAYGVNYRHNINNRFAITFQGIRCVLAGDDADSESNYQRIRNSRFETEIIDLSLHGEVNFLPLKRGSKYEFVSPFLSLGGCMIIGAFPGAGMQFGIPFGFGLKIAPTDRITISFEWKYRKTFTDYIDKINDDSYNTNLPKEAIKQRSYLGDKDWYSFAGIALSLQLFRPDNNCPAYR